MALYAQAGGVTCAGGRTREREDEVGAPLPLRDLLNTPNFRALGRTLIFEGAPLQA